MRIRSHAFTLPFNCPVTLGKSSPCLSLSNPIYSIRRVCLCYFIPAPTLPLLLPCSVPWKVGPCGLHHRSPLLAVFWGLEAREKQQCFFPLPSFFGSQFRQHLGPSTASVLWADLCVMLPVFNATNMPHPQASNSTTPAPRPCEASHCC